MSLGFSTPKLPILHLPDTLADWPWPRSINPHYQEVKEESTAWFHAFEALSPQSQKAFDKCNFALLASLAYPWVSKEHLRTGCDLMHVFFLVDEYTDVEPAHVVLEMINIVLDAMKNPHKPRPEGEVILGEIARQFWERGVETATPTSQVHMIETITEFLESIVDQAADRENDRYRSVEEYLERRRANVGTRPSCVPLELGLHLTDDVFYHPVLVELTDYIVEIIIIDNDIMSYNREQAMGDDRYNLIAVAMRQFQLDFDGAVDWAVQYHSELQAKFLAALHRVPTFGDAKIDREVAEYVRGLGNWPRCNDCWSFEGERYFGDKGLEYKETRLVPLLPKVVKSENGPGRRKGEVNILSMEELESPLQSPV
ncbi:terpene cyclase [Steccherinum ochraceum]|uniref:Terpene synthase n=1 Tax=Steccherinum ochraceum TaxID=92696 RepID=A0A4R0R504_9APHY|nr:terpene cyclase [Steccherinum ochraceum]